MRLRKELLKYIAKEIMAHENWSVISNPLIEFDPNNSEDLQTVANLEVYIASKK